MRAIDKAADSDSDTLVPHACRRHAWQCKFCAVEPNARTAPVGKLMRQSSAQAVYALMEQPGHHAALNCLGELTPLVAAGGAVGDQGRTKAKLRRGSGPGRVGQGGSHL